MAIRATRRFETTNRAVNKLAELLRRKGYAVKGANVSYTRSLTLYRFKVEPPTEDGFGYTAQHFTIRAPYTHMLEYIDNLPDVMEE